MNQIEDVTSLRALKNLEHIFVDSNAIRDLAPFSELTKSETVAAIGADTARNLSLFDNPISDISL